MANVRVRGLVFLAAFIAFAFVCAIIPFVVMPSAGSGVALPVIEVPGEVVAAGGFFGLNLTNTIIGTLITSAIVLIMAGILWRASKGWTKEVPGRAQALFEMLSETLYNFLYGVGGERLKVTPLLWPLVATIFIFLLVANYTKLLPGVETVGTLHCAYEGQSGYPMVRGWTEGSYRLWVDAPLSAGTTQSNETYDICNEYFKGYGKYWFNGFGVETPEEIAAQAAIFEEEIEGFQGQTELTAEQEDELHAAEYYVEYAPLRAETAALYFQLEAEVAEAEAIVARLEDTTVEAIETGAEAESVGEQAVPEAEEDVESAEELAAEAEAAEEALAEELADEPTPDELDTEFAEVFASAEELEAAREDARDLLNDRVEQLNLARSQLVYPGAVLPFTEEQIESGAKPFIFHITPFVRGAATDLSFTIALAVIAIVAVQIYGVRALGPSYFEKFINLSAVGNAGKRPLGVIDFIVGLIEIISEIGKIVSLAFRLFGNLFAGGVALMAMTFLLALFIPGIILGLELIIGLVQALVFAVLTLVFSVQAMESHHHDDDHHDDDHHGAAAEAH